MIFVAIQETKIKINKEFAIPEELQEAWFVSKGIRWQDYRAMPLHLIEELKTYWYLQNVLDNLEK